MPTNFYECPNQHIFEHVTPTQGRTVYKDFSTRKPSTVQCPICYEDALITYLTPRQARNARAFEPSVFFVRGSELFVPGTNDTSQLKGHDQRLLKQGYKKVEITNFRQYEQFQREHSKALKEHQQREIHERREAYRNAMKSSIDDIKNGYTYEKPIYDANGKCIRTEQVQIPPLHKLHPLARQVAEQAIRDYDNLDSFKERDRVPYIDAFENDSPASDEGRLGSKKWY